MKKILCVMGVAALLLGASSCSKSGSTASSPEADSLGITMGKAIGMSIGADFKSMPEADKAKFNKDQFLAGLKTVLLADTANMAYLQGVSVGMNMLMQLMQMNNDSVQVNRDLLYKNFAEYYKLDSVSADQQQAIQMEYQTLMQSVQAKAMARYQARQQAAQQAKQAEGDSIEAADKAYMEQVKASDPDIKTTEDGLSYKVLANGNGAKAKDGDTVMVKYVGKLTNGKQFDASGDEPVRMNVNGVVPGFKEGLKMMSPGSKMILYIPGNLAYGVNSPSPEIPPMSTLVFEVELVDVNPSK